MYATQSSFENRGGMANSDFKIKAASRTLVMDS